MKPIGVRRHWRLERPPPSDALGQGVTIPSTGSLSVSRARVKFRVFVDFDGTIATVDTTDLLLERFAAPAWRDIEDDWKAGRIGSRECLVRQIDLVRASEAEMDAFVADIEIDRGFPQFARLCRRLGHSVTVVSDGLDRTIAAVLNRYDLDLPFYANRLQWQGGDRWRLSFPHARLDCQALSGTCKCRFTEGEPRQLRMFVGDGRSDICAAGRVDLVLAKGALLDRCRSESLPHMAFADFDDASRLLAGWLEQCQHTGIGTPAPRVED
jgi:2-hydroxy-3-keto-5-methylthiopentenyl-1-phosphate phosphatase